MAAPDPDRKYLSPKEFARLSGLSEVTVRRYLKAGQLPHAQPGGERGRILIPRDALTGLQPPSEPQETQEHVTSESPPLGGRELSGPSPQWMKDLPKQNED